MRWLREFLPTAVGEKIRLVTAMVLLLTLSAILSVFSFSDVRILLVKISDFVARGITEKPSPVHIARTVDLVDQRIPGKRTCLVRSLSTEILLRLYGYVPEHRIGVRMRSHGELAAHSWLEYENEILIGDQDNLSEFSQLPPLDCDRT